MRRPIVSKSERSGTGVDMANLSKAVCHGDQINADSGIRRRSQTFRDLVLDGHESDFKSLLDSSAAESLYKRITNSTLSTIQFRAKDDISSGGRQGPLRTIFS